MSRLTNPTKIQPPKTWPARVRSAMLHCQIEKDSHPNRRHPDPQRSRQGDREAAGVGGFGGHGVRIPRAGGGMNASRFTKPHPIFPS